MSSNPPPDLRSMLVKATEVTVASNHVEAAVVTIKTVKTPHGATQADLAMYQAALTMFQKRCVAGVTTAAHHRGLLDKAKVNDNGSQQNGVKAVARSASDGDIGRAKQPKP